MTRRLARRVAQDGNPLRRPCDRAEDRCTAGMLIVLVVAGPLLAWWAARVTYAEEVRAAAWESRHRFAVQAVLLEPAGPATPNGTRTVAQARWSAPDGAWQTGKLPVPRQSVAGALIPIWVDESGSLSPPPAQRLPAMEAAAVATAVLCGLALLRVVLLGLLRALFDRHRLRTWQTGWLEVEPRWSGHL